MEKMDVDEATELQGAIDWAHSIQKRQAETLMAAVARNAGTEDMDPDYRKGLLQLALDAGVDQDITERMFNHPKLEKVSEFDEPDVRRASNDLVEMLTKTMSSAGMSTGGRKLLVSSLASGQVNALCATNTWDEKYYHVFIDSDLTVFCNSVGKLVAECLVRDNMATGEVDLDPAKIAGNVQSDDIQKRAADLFCSTVLKGTPRASEPWLPTVESFELALLLTNALNMFPIAHELGHLHLGHLESDETRQVSVEGIEELDAAVYSQKDEFAADSVGATVTNQTMIRLEASNAFTFLAPYIFLKSVEVLDACYEVYDEHAGAMSFTHPSAQERAQRIRTVLIMHAQYHNSGKILPLALRAIDLICHGLGLAALTNLQSLKSKGKTPRERIRLSVSECGRPRILGFFPNRDPDTTR
ncbi:hypothetical protein GRI58_15250 [Porphyrobacter algicida]|uniref:Uncharacterized protein n=1 Tax=Qipengyuania algicida TaxID=1836209 RepID=A0A845AMQ2_9SPHN|nr:hypothetical protein [Qipengyuania algicida]MXP30165.1 hypothetical protein [Qipengyuania algicida]